MAHIKKKELVRQVAEILGKEAGHDGLVRIEVIALRERLWPAGDYPDGWDESIYRVLKTLHNDGFINSCNVEVDKDIPEIVVELKKVLLVKSKE